MEKVLFNKGEDVIATVVEQVNEMLSKSVPAKQILECIALFAEQFIPRGEVCSILVLDNKGLLRNGASPRLPSDYLSAIDKLKPNPNIGTCVAAAATGNIIITEDFLADNKWSELKHLPLSIGFVGAWSMPIKDDSGKVLGTFGTYFKSHRSPDEDEINKIGMLAKLSARVLSSDYGSPLQISA